MTSQRRARRAITRVVAAIFLNNHIERWRLHSAETTRCKATIRGSSTFEWSAGDEFLAVVQSPVLPRFVLYCYCVALLQSFNVFPCMFILYKHSVLVILRSTVRHVSDLCLPQGLRFFGTASCSWHECRLHRLFCLNNGLGSTILNNALEMSYYNVIMQYTILLS